MRELSFTYGGANQPALEGVSLEVESGEVVLLAGRSGSGKSTLIRALAGLVPHFHGGRFEGTVDVDGLDTRAARPAELAGTVATVFQDPEDQVVFGGVAAEVAFGLENAGTAPDEIAGRVNDALDAVGALHLLHREVRELSGGELQRICLASALALEPALLLLDEPTSQLDPEGAVAFLSLVRALARERATAVVLSEQRVGRALGMCDRFIVLESGRITHGADPATWLWPARPLSARCTARDVLCRVEEATFGYTAGEPPVFDRASFELRRGEIVALTGPNGSGKSTLGKLVTGLLEPDRGSVSRTGRASYLSQDPGRYLARERCDDEVRLGARDRTTAARALESVGLAGYDERHPRDLSSGERERLALAAVLATEPDVLVLDEPTRGVDPAARRGLAALLRRQSPGRATLVITHDLDLVAAVADRVIELAPQEARLAA